MDEDIGNGWDPRRIGLLATDNMTPSRLILNSLSRLREQLMTQNVTTEGRLAGWITKRGAHM